MTFRYNLPYKHKETMQHKKSKEETKHKKRTPLQREKRFLTFGLIYLVVVGELAVYFFVQFQYWNVIWIVIMLLFAVALSPCVGMFYLIARQARKHNESIFSLINQILYR